MAGTIDGGKAAAATNKLKYGADFYARIGSMGGKNGKTGGFAADIVCDCDAFDALYEYDTTHYKRQCAGKKGGLISRRGRRTEAANV